MVVSTEATAWNIMEISRERERELLGIQNAKRGTEISQTSIKVLHMPVAAKLQSSTEENDKQNQALKSLKFFTRNTEKRKKKKKYIGWEAHLRLDVARNTGKEVVDLKDVALHPPLLSLRHGRHRSLRFHPRFTTESH